jgi:hypothetical protein
MEEARVVMEDTKEEAPTTEAAPEDMVATPVEELEATEEALDTDHLALTEAARADMEAPVVWEVVTETTTLPATAEEAHPVWVATVDPVPAAETTEAPATTAPDPAADLMEAQAPDLVPAAETTVDPVPAAETTEAPAAATTALAPAADLMEAQAPDLEWEATTEVPLDSEEDTEDQAEVALQATTETPTPEVDLAATEVHPEDMEDQDLALDPALDLDLAWVEATAAPWEEDIAAHLAWAADVAVPPTAKADKVALPTVDTLVDTAVLPEWEEDPTAVTVMTITAEADTKISTTLGLDTVTKPFCYYSSSS